MPRGIAAVSLCLLSASAAFAQQATGRWQGVLEAPGESLEIRVDLVSDEASARGTIDIPAQGLRNVALSDVSVQGAAVSFSIAGIPGPPRFEATISGDSMTGALSQSGLTIPFRLERDPQVGPQHLGPNLAPAPSPAGVPGHGFEGVWLGSLDAGVTELRLLVRLLPDGEGGLTGSLDSLDQGARGLEVDRVEVDGSALRLALSKLGASFQGDLNNDGSAISGVWRQNGELPLVLYRQPGEPDTSRAQDPKPPFPYSEQEVLYRNEDAGIDLAGTLTFPSGDGPHPAALLLTGSGPQDRNETIMGHRPFLVLADALARRGIAVLRVDDRGVGGSGGSVSRSTTADFTDDALAGLSLLQSRPEIDARRVGLVGHSEGATIASLAASRSDQVAFIVLLAHPGMTGEDVIYSQSQLIAKKMLLDDETIEANLELQRRIFAILKQEPDDARAGEKIQALLADSMPLIPEQGKQALRSAGAASTVNPWFRFVGAM